MVSDRGFLCTYRRQLIPEREMNTTRMLDPLWSRGRDLKARKVSVCEIKQMNNLTGPPAERVCEAIPWLSTEKFHDPLVVGKRSENISISDVINNCEER